MRAARCPRHARSRDASALYRALGGRSRSLPPLAVGSLSARRTARRALDGLGSTGSAVAVGLVSCRRRVARCPHVPHVAAPCRTRRSICRAVVAPATRRHLAAHVGRCRSKCRAVRRVPTRSHRSAYVRQCAASVGHDFGGKRKRSRYLGAWYRLCITRSRFRGAAYCVAKTSHAVSWRENAPRNAAKLPRTLGRFSRFRKNAMIPHGCERF